MVVIKHLNTMERNMSKKWRGTIDFKEVVLTRLLSGTLTRYLSSKSKKEMSVS